MPGMSPDRGITMPEVPPARRATMLETSPCPDNIPALP